MPKPINQQDQLRALLERLNLGAMAANFADLALRAAKEHLSHEAYYYSPTYKDQAEEANRVSCGSKIWRMRSQIPSLHQR
jgi:hypothetical protein